jgi:hypothetical protein
MNDNLVSWKSQKQSVTSKSSAESEYVALSAAVSEVVYIYQLCKELGFAVKKPISIFEDNTTAIKLSLNPIKKSKVKHMNIHHHFIRDYVELGVIDIFHVSSDLQIGDLFTKNLNGPMFQDFVKKLNLGVFG